MPLNAPRTLRFASLMLGVLAAACSDGPTAGSRAEVLAAEVDSSAGSIFRTLDVRLSRPAGAEVEYWSAATPPLRVRARSEAGEHSLFLPRLRASTAYQYQVWATDARGRPRGQPSAGEFTTSALPAEMAAIRFRAVGRPTLPVTVLELMTRPADAGRRLVAVDEDGEVVWYYPREGALKILGFTRRANGNYVILEWGEGLREVAPDGRLVSRITAQPGVWVPHHDVVATPQNTVIFLSAEWQSFGDSSAVGEAIWEWNPDTGALDRRWRSSSAFSWPRDRGPLSTPNDWLHSNSLSMGPRGNVVVSSRSTHQVISIAPGWGPLEWKLGGEGSTFAIDPADRFLAQHTATEVAPNRVLLFDNGFERPGGAYSRALELELNPATGTARRVWEFRPTPDNYASIISSARRLPNGNTLVQFGTAPGMVGSSGPVEAYEVDPHGGRAWHLQLVNAPPWQFSYRATPLASVGGEEPAP